MSDSAAAAKQNALQKPLPAWVTSGVLGVLLGGGATLLGLYFYGYLNPQTGPAGGPPGTAMSGMMGSGGGGMGGGGMGGGGMGGGGMGGGGMGGGGMGGGGMGGGGPRGKRNLTTLVGKLDLAGRGISFTLDGDQSAKLAAQLAELEKPDKLTQEEAQERCDILEAILTDDQKETLAQFELPRGGRGGGGAGGGAGGGMVGRGGQGGMAADPAQPDDNNPFQDKVNSNRLHSLLERLQAAPAEKPAAAPAGAG